jgi:hypothetical protein
MGDLRTKHNTKNRLDVGLLRRNIRLNCVTPFFFFFPAGGYFLFGGDFY